jgi:hypothetical protein
MKNHYASQKLFGLKVPNNSQNLFRQEFVFSGHDYCALPSGTCSITNNLQKGVDHGYPKKIEGILGRGKGFL